MKRSTTASMPSAPNSSMRPRTSAGKRSNAACGWGELLMISSVADVLLIEDRPRKRPAKRQSRTPKAPRQRGAGEPKCAAFWGDRASLTGASSWLVGWERPRRAASLRTVSGGAAGARKPPRPSERGGPVRDRSVGRIPDDGEHVG